MEAMYVFRFNPVFQQWVMLGPALQATFTVEKAHLLEPTRGASFVAASHPRHPFLIEPELGKPESSVKGRLFIDQPAVGEYELLLYRGEESSFAWGKAEWIEWFALIQQRILGFHRNPHLHYLQFSFYTESEETIEGYRRVGDLVATSHPICGAVPVLSRELADKVREKEALYQAHADEYGVLYVPTAPLYDQEVWYLPLPYKSGIEHAVKGEREQVAKLLAKLFPALHREFPGNHYTLRIHTLLSDRKEECTWWLQIYRSQPDISPVPVRPLPETFRTHLHSLLS